MSIIKTNLLLLLREITAVSSDNQIKHKTTVYTVWTLQVYWLESKARML